MRETFDIAGRHFARVTLPSCATDEVRMVQEGWFFADRTVKTSIPLAKVTMDLKRFQRLPMEETEGYREDIFHIAHESFTQDRRFHVAPECNPEVSAAILRTWVDALGPTLVCFFREQPVGFLNLQGNFVHLAAVEEKHRATGAAMGLYAKAISLARERGFQTLEGRISTQNTPVMNLYAFFGAQFSEPEDVFLREEEGGRV